ncbi:MAG TPA: protein-glutamate O-methyltransferase CheR [Firmicutes bacterium]|nr:protein-glutamate O-methyltransferase CheR [Bacillota bacterium]
MFKPKVPHPTDQEIQEICQIINETLGFNYTSRKKYLIQNRLNRHLLRLGLDNYHTYLALLRKEPQERNTLCELLTTNVTYFFREPLQFEYLAQTLLPSLSKEKKGTRKIRCWSAGSSSGEEAYSIAITCRETLGSGWDLKVLATDISSTHLTLGSEGVYPREKLESVPEKLRRKYFRPHEAMKEHYYIIPELRKDIIFRLANLLEEDSLPRRVRVDLIFCRNVFIYLSKEARTQILNHFYSRLNTGGYLFLGHSESIVSAAEPRWILLGKSVYKKR